MNHNNLLLGSVKISSLAEKLFMRLDPKLAPLSHVIALKKSNEGVGLFTDGSSELSRAAEIELRKIVEEKEEPFSLSDPLFEFELISFFRDYVEKTDAANSRISFFTTQVTNERFFIVIVLQFDLAQYSIHNRLNNGYRGTVHSYLSLLDATVERFLLDSTKYINNILNDAGLRIDESDNEGEVIRWAGKALMLSINMKSSGPSSQIVTAFEPVKGYSLFDDFNMISSLFYEGRPCRGKMIVSSNPHENIAELYHLGNPIPLTNHRSVRKLLEICSDEHFLLSTAGYIYGIGSLRGNYNRDREDLFQIHFKKHYSWVLLNGSSELMAVTYGNPKMTDRPCDRVEVIEILENEFKSIGRSRAEDILELIYYATFQKNGTILVILDDVQKEVSRLENQAVLFDPFELTIENLLKFSNIDGAIIIDVDRRCYAVGVILDGVASERGSPSRGARYNSAVRYIDSLDIPSIAVVVSEDGMVDIIT
jgi:hypothetical protein